MTMKIEILEPTGIKTAEYGHMLAGEQRIVSEQFGHFACANGWARHLPAEGSPAVETGQRGSQDYADPATWQPGDPPKKRQVQPADGKLA